MMLFVVAVVVLLVKSKGVRVPRQLARNFYFPERFQFPFVSAISKMDIGAIKVTYV
jgi:hypothetical protein